MKRRDKIPVWINAFSTHNNPVSFHRRNLPHVQRDYRPHFITFCTKDLRVLPDWARKIVLDCCTHGHETIYNLYVAVVMPDHVHMILTPLENRDRLMISSLPEIMKGIKGTAAHAINRRLKRRGPVWLEESFDHVVRSDASLDAKIAYILANPVRKGLVSLPDEYPWLWARPKP